ncbi:MAG: hypothetical protein HYW48_03230 [Deltaproteobacteria bacterium]|nr:hypothetical protein [Deltaproteobacteria bacterium]
MEETAQLVPPRNPLGERPFALLRAGFSLAPPKPPSPYLPQIDTASGLMESLMKLFLLSLTIGICFFTGVPAKASAIPISLQANKGEFRFLKQGNGLRWYISFLDNFSNIRAALPSGASIVIRFAHGNFSGNSYLLHLSDQPRRVLEEAASGHVMGIWDYIACQRSELSLMPLNPFQYAIWVSSLQACTYEWDD